MRGQGKHNLWAAVVVILLLPGVCTAAHPSSEVQVDAGYIMPGGDLADGFRTTDLGFGADPGLEIGFLWRYRFNRSWSLATAFHFVDFGVFNGTDETVGDYRIRVTSYRYGLQLRRSFGRETGWQPFLMAGVGVFHNRVEARDKVFLEPFDRSLSSLGYSFQAGIRRGNIEVGVVGAVNRFSTWRLFQPDREQHYNWDAVSVRFSWLIPRS